MCGVIPRLLARGRFAPRCIPQTQGGPSPPENPPRRDPPRQAVIQAVQEALSPVARKPRPSPFTVRLSPEQRAELERRADRAELSLGGYFIAAAFATPPPRQSRRPAANRELLAQILASFGRIGSNVNQLARVANAGSWPDSRLLKQACDDVRMIRDMLIRALGFTPPEDPPAPGPPA